MGVEGRRLWRFCRDGRRGVIFCGFDLGMRVLLLSAAVLCGVVGVVGELLSLHLLLTPPLLQRLQPVRLLRLLPTGGAQQIAEPHRARNASNACYNGAE